MIALLRGTLVERTTEVGSRGQTSTVIVDCEVVVSTATLVALPEVGEQVTLRVYTHAQENKIALYGFATVEERELFDRLITVKNVGPSTAVEILSGAPSPQELAALVAAGDLATLTRIKGVGKKRAELVVVELKDKCEVLLASWRSRGVTAPPPPARSATGRPAVLDDVASALINMQFRPPVVEDVVGRLQVTEGATLESLLREALKELRDLPR